MVCGTKEAIAYYSERARGGAGTIIVNTGFDVFANDDFWGQPGGVASFVESVHVLPNSVHEAGAKIGIQFAHLNRFPEGLSPRATGKAVAPSHRIESDPQSFHLRPGEIMRELTIGEIQLIIAKFAKAAANAKEAGFDFVELHGAHGHLPCQFFSPIYNCRSDKYGGDLAGRMRFGLECATAAREAVGDNYPLFVRIGAEGTGITIPDSIEFAKELLKSGVDVIDVSVAEHQASPTSDKPFGTFVYLAQAIKHEAKVPVIAVGRIHTPEVAEAILVERKADLVAIGRQLIADPFWPEKVARGATDEITPCLSCNRCCEAFERNSELECTINASAGREEQYRITAAEQPKRVLVVGGGPAGMEAARVAAMRGHDVTLSEKEARLGGQLLVAAAALHNEMIGKLTNFLAGQMEKTGVKVELNDEVSAGSVVESKPDVVVVATGVVPFIPDIPGVERSNVVLAEDVLRGCTEVGDKCVIIGGELVGCDTAEFLVEKGKQVTLVRRGPTIAAQMLPQFRQPLLERLTANGVAMLTGVKYEEITERGLVIINNEREKQTIEADTIVLAAGARSNTCLGKELEGKAVSLYEIGDCVEPRRICEAIADGARFGRDI